MRISDWSSDVCSSDLYRFGYTKVEIDEPAILSPDVQPQDIFDSSTNHAAWASLGARPGDLPFGWKVSGGYEREDARQLDQRYDGKYERAALTIPIDPTFALPGVIRQHANDVRHTHLIPADKTVQERYAQGRITPAP